MQGSIGRHRFPPLRRRGCTHKTLLLRISLPAMRASSMDGDRRRNEEKGYRRRLRSRYILSIGRSRNKDNSSSAGGREVTIPGQHPIGDKLPEIKQERGIGGVR